MQCRAGKIRNGDQLKRRPAAPGRGKRSTNIQGTERAHTKEHKREHRTAAHEGKKKHKPTEHRKERRATAHQAERKETREAAEAVAPAGPKLDPQLGRWQLHQAPHGRRRRSRVAQLLLHCRRPLGDARGLDDVEQSALEVDNE